MYFYYLVTFLFLTLFSYTLQAYSVDNENINKYSPWIISEVKGADKSELLNDYNLCPKVSLSPQESCTVWKMLHKNDNNSMYPFYFSRIDEVNNPIAEDCVTKKVIKDKMVQTTNNALGISKNNENGVLFDADYPRSECLIAAKCVNGINCRKDSYFSVQAAYSGFLPAGFGGCQGIINAVKPIMKSCENESDNNTLTIGLGSAAGVVGLVLSIWASFKLYSILR